MIAIVDYKLGNIFSIKNIFLKLNYNVVVTSDPEIILNSKIVVLPGVGAFDVAMQNINDLGLAGVLKKVSVDKKFIGICLGFQLLFEQSLENKKTKGLGIIKGKIFSLKKKNRNKIVPHVGWNTTYLRNYNANKKYVKLLNNKYFYFIHSFYAEPKNSKDILTLTKYENIIFCSSILKNNVLGLQFHPEKSGMNGIKLIKNFLDK